MAYMKMKVEFEGDTAEALKLLAQLHELQTMQSTSPIKTDVQPEENYTLEKAAMALKADKVTKARCIRQIGAIAGKRLNKVQVHELVEKVYFKPKRARRERGEKTSWKSTFGKSLTAVIVEKLASGKTDKKELVQEICQEARQNKNTMPQEEMEKKINAGVHTTVCGIKNGKIKLKGSQIEDLSLEAASVLK